MPLWIYAPMQRVKGKKEQVGLFPGGRVLRGDGSGRQNAPPADPPGASSNAGAGAFSLAAAWAARCVLDPGERLTPQRKTPLRSSPYSKFLAPCSSSAPHLRAPRVHIARSDHPLLRALAQADDEAAATEQLRVGLLKPTYSRGQQEVQDSHRPGGQCCPQHVRFKGAGRTHRVLQRPSWGEAAP